MWIQKSNLVKENISTQVRNAISSDHSGMLQWPKYKASFVKLPNLPLQLWKKFFSLNFRLLKHCNSIICSKLIREEDCLQLEHCRSTVPPSLTLSPLLNMSLSTMKIFSILFLCKNSSTGTLGLFWKVQQSEKSWLRRLIKKFAIFLCELKRKKIPYKKEDNGK